jgi:predicted ATPase/tRNA A-37 threonylcarbamoyl transferase component Bud32
MLAAILNQRYRLEEEIGQGGMGIVYKAYDQLLERVVALKILNEYSKTRLGSAGRARLLHEAQAAGRLSHPNIVSIYDAGEANDTPFIVMEYIEGSSLYDKKPGSLSEILSIGRQICSALHHAHLNGIIHRDLKPENIIVTPTGSVKLTDFGLARSLSTRMTEEGLIVGTVLYLSPEAAMRQTIDGRSDLYSFGIILYELITNNLPYNAEDPLAVISQHLYSPLVPARAHRADLPPALDQLISKLLEKQPEDRPSNAAEVASVLADLENLLKLPESNISQTYEPATFSLDRIVRGRLIGREQDLAEATAVWRRTIAGIGHVLLLSGEPGIGKTRLARELLAQAAVSGSMIFSGSCYSEGGVPYSPFPEMIKESFNKLKDSIDLPDFVMVDLLRICPELSPKFPHLPHLQLDTQTEQQRIFESIVTWVESLTARSPVVIFIDDIHWADSSTLNLIRYLARRMENDRLLLLFTYREIDLLNTNQIESVLNDLYKERLSTRLKITRLDREQTKTMLENMLLPAGEINSDLIDAIYRETEGNPFYIEEVTKALIEEGKLCYQDICWVSTNGQDIQIPQSVRATIQSRLARLPGVSQDVLRLASILGRQFDFDVLKQASDMDEDDLIDALEMAEKAQIINEVSTSRTGATRFSFAHALIPSTLKDTVSTLRRQRLHRRVAEAIEHVHAGEETLLDTLAYHYENSGDAEKALSYYLRAGERALKVYANKEAEHYFKEALELDTVSSGSPQILAGLGEALFRQSMYKEASKLWEQVIELFQHKHDHNNMALYYARAGRSAWYQNKRSEGLEICRQGLQAIEEMGVPYEETQTAGMAALLHETARAYYFNHKHTEALDLCQKALSLAEVLGLAEVQAETLATMGILENQEPEIREDYLRRAVQIADEANLPATSVRAHNNLGSHLAWKMDLIQARDHKIKAKDLAHRMGTASWEHGFLGEAIDYSLSLGDFKEVERGLEELEEIRKRFAHNEKVMYYVNYIRVSYFFQQGQLEEALSLLDNCIDEENLDSHDPHAVISNVKSMYGNIFYQLGRLDEAANALEEAIEYEKLESDFTRVSDRTLLSVIHHKMGSKEKAYRLLDEAMSMAKSRKQSSFEDVQIQLALARHAVIEERWQEAFDTYEKLWKLFLQHKIKWHHAYLLLEWAKALQKRGRTETHTKSKELLKEAHALFVEMNIPYYQNECEKLMKNNPEDIPSI